MSSEIQGNSLVIHGQYIKDLSFENPNAPESFSTNEQPGIDLSLDISTNKVEEHTFEVTTLVNVRSHIQDKVLFVVELEYTGIFTVHAESPEDLERILLVKCPEILFPYVRRVIFNLTGDGGFIPLTLQPIDFLGLYQQKKTANIN